MQLWRLVSKFVLHPDLPFELHKLLYHATYADWDAGKQGPAPCWVPDPQAVHFTNVARFMHSFKVWSLQSRTYLAINVWYLQSRNSPSLGD